MFVEKLIASRLKLKSGLSIAATAVSFFVIIIAVAISSGFSSEIRKEVSEICGDITISNSFSDYSTDEYPLNTNFEINYPGILSKQSAIYRSGIAHQGGEIKGLIYKGIESKDSDNSAKDDFTVKIPEALALKLKLNIGDEFKTYFIGNQIQEKSFTVEEIYNSALGSEDALIAFTSLKAMQEINGWEESEASVIELKLETKIAKSRKLTEELCHQIAEDTQLAVFSSRDKYSDLFDWLEMIEVNVKAIILLMTIVAGFNMISGLLILIFRNTSLIGKLKTMGMRNSGIAGIFLRAGARISSLGLAIGNGAALLFCFLQNLTHAIKLNPENYFVSFVPVNVEIKGIIIADCIAFAAIMLLLLIPTLVISRLDPSQTVKEDS